MLPHEKNFAHPKCRQTTEALMLLSFRDCKCCKPGKLSYFRSETILILKLSTSLSDVCPLRVVAPARGRRL